MSPNKLLATTTSNQSWVHNEVGGENVDMKLIHGDIRVTFGHRFHALVPIQHGDRDTVGLVDDVS